MALSQFQTISPFPGQSFLQKNKESPQGSVCTLRSKNEKVVRLPHRCISPCAELSSSLVASSDARKLFKGLSRQAKHSTKSHADVEVIPVVSVADHELRALPYPTNGLEPVMSEETVALHWGGHQRKYVENLNAQLEVEEDEELKRMELEDLVKVAYNNGNPLPLFNNAAQVWNHEFFWDGMKPDGGGKPTGEVLRLIERDFGSFENFSKDFSEAAQTTFGSGWVWLSAKVETLVPEEFLIDFRVPHNYRLSVARLVIEKTSNALNPLVFGRIPLLALDVWEHAYYIDHRNRRPDFISSFLDGLVSWDEVAKRVTRGKASANFWEMPTPEESYLKPGQIGQFAIGEIVVENPPPSS